MLLDEVGDVAPAMQAKLLRVLQAGVFERVGGTESVKVDVRIIAATHKRLEDEVEAGRFRKDLFYRLNVIRLELPPLRERKEDVPLLATHFLERYRSNATTPVTEIDPDAMQTLLQHDWPGNVRELENAIKSAIAFADGSIIRRANLPETLLPRLPQKLAGCAHRYRAAASRAHGRPHRPGRARVLPALLTEYHGNVARYARHSGLSRRNATQKNQRYGLERIQLSSTGSPKRAQRDSGEVKLTPYFAIVIG